MLSAGGRKHGLDTICLVTALCVCQSQLKMPDDDHGPRTILLSCGAYHKQGKLHIWASMQHDLTTRRYFLTRAMTLMESDGVWLCQSIERGPRRDAMGQLDLHACRPW